MSKTPFTTCERCGRDTRRRSGICAVGVAAVKSGAHWWWCVDFVAGTGGRTEFVLPGAVRAPGDTGK